MKIWTKGRGGWKYHPSLTQGLRYLAITPEDSVFLFTETPSEEISEIEAFMRLASITGVLSSSVIVATPHPSAGFLSSLDKVDVKRIQVTSMKDGDTPGDFFFEIKDILLQICPELDSCRSQKATFSVCRAHKSRMILSPHLMLRWCLAGYKECPHWKLVCHES